MGDPERTLDEPQSENSTIKSVETSIEIVEVLKRKGEATIKELAEETDFSTANVYKHLNTLVVHGFVTRSDGIYRLGFRYLDFGGQVRERMEGAQQIKRKVAKIAEMTGEVAQYMIEERGRSVIVFKEVGHRGVSLRTRVGIRLPIHQVASGKAMLAYVPESRVDEIVEHHGLPAATENTITTREGLFDELAEIREDGYALNQAESTRGLFAVSVPVCTPDDRAIGACTVSGPEHRMTDGDDPDQIVETLLSIVNEIELNLTHS